MNPVPLSKISLIDTSAHVHRCVRKCGWVFVLDGVMVVSLWCRIVNELRQVMLPQVITAGRTECPAGAMALTYRERLNCLHVTLQSKLTGNAGTRDCSFLLMKILQNKLKAVIYSKIHPAGPHLHQDYRDGALHPFEKNLTLTCVFFFSLRWIDSTEAAMQDVLSWFLNDSVCLNAGIIAAKNRSTSSDALLHRHTAPHPT